MFQQDGDLIKDAFKLEFVLMLKKICSGAAESKNHADADLLQQLWVLWKFL